MNKNCGMNKKAKCLHNFQTLLIAQIEKAKTGVREDVGMSSGPKTSYSARVVASSAHYRTRLLNISSSSSGLPSVSRPPDNRRRHSDENGEPSRVLPVDDNRASSLADSRRRKAPPATPYDDPLPSNQIRNSEALKGRNKDAVLSMASPRKRKAYGGGTEAASADTCVSASPKKVFIVEQDQQSRRKAIQGSQTLEHHKHGPQVFDDGPDVLNEIMKDTDKDTAVVYPRSSRVLDDDSSSVLSRSEKATGKYNTVHGPRFVDDACGTSDISVKTTEKDSIVLSRGSQVLDGASGAMDKFIQAKERDTVMDMHDYSFPLDAPGTSSELLGTRDKDNVVDNTWAPPSSESESDLNILTYGSQRQGLHPTAVIPHEQSAAAVDESLRKTDEGETLSARNEDTEVDNTAETVIPCPKRSCIVDDVLLGASSAFCQSLKANTAEKASSVNLNREKDTRAEPSSSCNEILESGGLQMPADVAEMNAEADKCADFAGTAICHADSLLRSQDSKSARGATRTAAETTNGEKNNAEHDLSVSMKPGLEASTTVKKGYIMNKNNQCLSLGKHEGGEVVRIDASRNTPSTHPTNDTTKKAKGRKVKTRGTETSTAVPQTVYPNTVTRTGNRDTGKKKSSQHTKLYEKCEFSNKSDCISKTLSVDDDYDCDFIHRHLVPIGNTGSQTHMSLHEELLLAEQQCRQENAQPDEKSNSEYSCFGDVQRRESDEKDESNALKVNVLLPQNECQRHPSDNSDMTVTPCNENFETVKQSETSDDVFFDAEDFSSDENQSAPSSGGTFQHNNRPTASMQTNRHDPELRTSSSCNLLCGAIDLDITTENESGISDYEDCCSDMEEATPETCVDVADSLHTCVAREETEYETMRGQDRVIITEIGASITVSSEPSVKYKRHAGDEVVQNSTLRDAGSFHLNHSNRRSSSESCLCFCVDNVVSWPETDEAEEKDRLRPDSKGEWGHLYQQSTDIWDHPAPVSTDDSRMSTDEYSDGSYDCVATSFSPPSTNHGPFCYGDMRQITRSRGRRHCSSPDVLYDAAASFSDQLVADEAETVGYFENATSIQDGRMFCEDSKMLMESCPMEEDILRCFQSLNNNSLPGSGRGSYRRLPGSGPCEFYVDPNDDEGYMLEYSYSRKRSPPQKDRKPPPWNRGYIRDPALPRAPVSSRRKARPTAVAESEATVAKVRALCSHPLDCKCLEFDCLRRRGELLHEHVMNNLDVLKQYASNRPRRRLNYSIKIKEAVGQKAKSLIEKQRALLGGSGRSTAVARPPSVSSLSRQRPCPGVPPKPREGQRFLPKQREAIPGECLPFQMKIPFRKVGAKPTSQQQASNSSGYTSRTSSRTSTLLQGKNVPPDVGETWRRSDERPKMALADTAGKKLIPLPPEDGTFTMETVSTSREQLSRDATITTPAMKSQQHEAMESVSYQRESTKPNGASVASETARPPIDLRRSGQHLNASLTEDRRDPGLARLDRSMSDALSRLQALRNQDEECDRLISQLENHRRHRYGAFTYDDAARTKCPVANNDRPRTKVCSHTVGDMLVLPDNNPSSTYYLSVQVPKAKPRCKSTAVALKPPPRQEAKFKAMNLETKHSIVRSGKTGTVTRELEKRQYNPMTKKTSYLYSLSQEKEPGFSGGKGLHDLQPVVDFVSSAIYLSEMEQLENGPNAKNATLVSSSHKLSDLYEVAVQTSPIQTCDAATNLANNATFVDSREKVKGEFMDRNRTLNQGAGRKKERVYTYSALRDSSEISSTPSTGVVKSMKTEDSVKGELHAVRAGSNSASPISSKSTPRRDPKQDSHKPADLEAEVTTVARSRAGEGVLTTMSHSTVRGPDSQNTESRLYEISKSVSPSGRVSTRRNKYTTTASSRSPSVASSVLSRVSDGFNHSSGPSIPGPSSPSPQKKALLDASPPSKAKTPLSSPGRTFTASSSNSSPVNKTPRHRQHAENSKGPSTPSSPRIKSENASPFGPYATSPSSRNTMKTVRSPPSRLSPFRTANNKSPNNRSRPNSLSPPKIAATNQRISPSPPKDPQTSTRAKSLVSPLRYSHPSALSPRPTPPEEMIKMTQTLEPVIVLGTGSPDAVNQTKETFISANSLSRENVSHPSSTHSSGSRESRSSPNKRRSPSRSPVSRRLFSPSSTSNFDASTPLEARGDRGSTALVARDLDSPGFSDVLLSYDAYSSSPRLRQSSPHPSHRRRHRSRSPKRKKRSKYSATSINSTHGGDPSSPARVSPPSSGRGSARSTTSSSGGRSSRRGGSRRSASPKSVQKTFGLMNTLLSPIKRLKQYIFPSDQPSPSQHSGAQKATLGSVVPSGAALTSTFSRLATPFLATVRCFFPSSVSSSPATRKTEPATYRRHHVQSSSRTSHTHISPSLSVESVTSSRSSETEVLVPSRSLTPSGGTGGSSGTVSESKRTSRGTSSVRRSTTMSVGPYSSPDGRTVPSITRNTVECYDERYLLYETYSNQYCAIATRIATLITVIAMVTGAYMCGCHCCLWSLSMKSSLDFERLVEDFVKHLNLRHIALPPL